MRSALFWDSTLRKITNDDRNCRGRLLHPIFLSQLGRKRATGQTKQLGLDRNMAGEGKEVEYKMDKDIEIRKQ